MKQQLRYVSQRGQIMMTAAGKLPKKDLVPYIVAQVAGGLAALELYKRVKI